MPFAEIVTYANPVNLDFSSPFSTKLRIYTGNLSHVFARMSDDLPEGLLFGHGTVIRLFAADHVLERNP